MEYTHCVGIDCGTSSIKIVVRDLEFDEVSPVVYPDGRIVTIPSFVSVTECGRIIIAASSKSMPARQWRFDNLKGKILFHREFSKQIGEDLPLICQIEGNAIPDSKWALNLSYAQPHYELMLALKLSYLMRRVQDDFHLHQGFPLWSLPLPVTSVKSGEAVSMRRAYTFALQASKEEQTSKTEYALSEYNHILANYKQFTRQESHAVAENLQIMPEGVCNIVAIASASFRHTDRFSLLDVGAATIELVTFSLEGQQLDIYHSTTSPLGIESLKSKGLALASAGDEITITDDASKQITNEIVRSLISPSKINTTYYKSKKVVDLFLCGGGSLARAINEIPQSIPENRLGPFGIPPIATQQNLAATAGYELIAAEMLPRYLVACGLSVPAENFASYRLPAELATLYREISEMDILKPYSYLDDNWDYTAIK